jgi:hypothetical protein
MMEAREQPIDEHIPSNRISCSSVTAPAKRRRQGVAKSLTLIHAPPIGSSCYSAAAKPRF